MRYISKKRKLVGGLVVPMLAIALVVLVIEGASLLHLPGGSHQQQAQQGKLTVVKDASKAGFDFLVPTASNDWQFDVKSPVFDASKGVVNYKVKLADGSNVTISQQPMPDELKPWDSSAKFNQFINVSNVTMSEPVGNGKVYFRAALTNGAPANGATSVIYATDDILMFGQAGEVLGYDKWAKLLEAMKPQSVSK